ncbi:hypothetical protein [Azospirillum isscasi]|uniref:Uncharacterized protein n=1 Tax=Azospirillum isscasi TaxID=3053926 RepID=A0ABU0WMT3_9PROT|nr:hypothetical protein [Azospirillum isscasi]MDQ2105537.1 hypothetical protein [Azospirillum isscasi]
MPRQKFIGDNVYEDMACHVFALSGDPAQQEAINNRYDRLGFLLLRLEPLPADGNVAQGLNVVTNNEILAGPGLDGLPAAVAAHSLPLLCREFGFVQQAGTNTRLWGRFRQGQLLPEHMYVTTPDGRIWDTMPGDPVYRRANNQGLNPGAYGDGADGNDVLLDPGEVFSVEVAALAPQTQAVVAAPDDQWQDVVEAVQAGGNGGGDESGENADNESVDGGGDYVAGEDEGALNDP